MDLKGLNISNFGERRNVANPVKADTTTPFQNARNVQQAVSGIAGAISSVGKHVLDNSYNEGSFKAGDALNNAKKRLATNPELATDVNFMKDYEDEVNSIQSEILGDGNQEKFKAEIGDKMITAMVQTTERAIIKQDKSITDRISSDFSVSGNQEKADTVIGNSRAYGTRQEQLVAGETSFRRNLPETLNNSLSNLASMDDSTNKKKVKEDYYENLSYANAMGYITNAELNAEQSKYAEGVSNIALRESISVTKNMDYSKAMAYTRETYELAQMEIIHNLELNETTQEQAINSLKANTSKIFKNIEENNQAKSSFATPRDSVATLKNNSIPTSNTIKGAYTAMQSNIDVLNSGSNLTPDKMGTAYSNLSPFLNNYINPTVTGAKKKLNKEDTQMLDMIRSIAIDKQGGNSEYISPEAFAHGVTQYQIIKNAPPAERERVKQAFEGLTSIDLIGNLNGETSYVFGLFDGADLTGISNPETMALMTNKAKLLMYSNKELTLNEALEDSYDSLLASNTLQSVEGEDGNILINLANTGSNTLIGNPEIMDEATQEAIQRISGTDGDADIQSMTVSPDNRMTIVYKPDGKESSIYVGDVDEFYKQSELYTSQSRKNDVVKVKSDLDNMAFILVKDLTNPTSNKEFDIDRYIKKLPKDLKENKEAFKYIEVLSKDAVQKRSEMMGQHDEALATREKEIRTSLNKRTGLSTKEKDIITRQRIGRIKSSSSIQLNREFDSWLDGELRGWKEDIDNNEITYDESNQVKEDARFAKEDEARIARNLSVMKGVDR